jgi:hypothetical protein
MQQKVIESSRHGWAHGWAHGGTRAILLAAVLAVTGSLGIASAQGRGKDFTPDDVTKIVSSLREADASIYLIRLPVFRDGRIVGQELYGTLPMKDVEQLAESLKVKLDPRANVIAVFDPGDTGDDQGGTSTNGKGTGPGSHINTQSAAWDLANRIEVLLEDIDTSSYQFLR